VIADADRFATAILPDKYQHHPTLRELATQLGLSRFASRAHSTVRTHHARWRDFTVWLTGIDTSLNPVGVPPSIVALYLQHVSLQSHADGIGPSRVLGASAAIACYHWFFGQDSPTQHPLCDLVRETSRRLLVAEPLQRDPISADDVRKLIDAFATPSSPLRDLMHVTVFALMYAGFLRFDDAAHISVHKDLMLFEPTHVSLFLSRSKTDQHMDGTWVVVAATAGRYCPVALLRRLLSEGGYQREPSHPLEDVGPLLRAMAPGGGALKRKTGSLADPIPSLGYSSLLDRCKEMCKAVGISKSVGLHSFRIGGATEAAAAGVPDRLFKRHGRWATDSSKERYVRESLQNVLMVSQALGL
jgi:hypothetical protein